MNIRHKLPKSWFAAGAACARLCRQAGGLSSKNNQKMNIFSVNILT